MGELTFARHVRIDGEDGRLLEPKLPPEGDATVRTRIGRVRLPATSTSVHTAVGTASNSPKRFMAPPLSWLLLVEG